MLLIFVIVYVQTVIRLFHWATLDDINLLLTESYHALFASETHSSPSTERSSAKQKTEYINILCVEVSSPKGWGGCLSPFPFQQLKENVLSYETKFL